MKDNQSQFIRKYKRASKSPWEDDSTILLYANVMAISGNDVALDFTHYIYLHRDNVGKVLGISISKSILDDNSEFSSRYLEGIEMCAILLIYIDDITEFCCLFSDEFESIFLLDPRDYFEIAVLRWFSIVENA